MIQLALFVALVLLVAIPLVTVLHRRGRTAAQARITSPARFYKAAGWAILAVALSGCTNPRLVELLQGCEMVQRRHMNSPTLPDAAKEIAMDNADSYAVALQIAIDRPLPEDTAERIAARQAAGGAS